MQWRSKTFTSDGHPGVPRYVRQGLGRAWLRACRSHGVHSGCGRCRGRWSRCLMVELCSGRHAGWSRRHRRSAVVLAQRVVHHRVSSHSRRVSATLVIRRGQTATSRERHRTPELLVMRHVRIHPRRRARRCRGRGRGPLRAAGARRACPQRCRSQAARQRTWQRRRQRRRQRRWQRRLYRRRPSTREQILVVELLVVLREHAIDDELGTHRSAATRRATIASREMRLSPAIRIDSRACTSTMAADRLWPAYEALRLRIPRRGERYRCRAPRSRQRNKPRACEWDATTIGGDPPEPSPSH